MTTQIIGIAVLIISLVAMTHQPARQTERINHRR